jgi:hypothetical protein
VEMIMIFFILFHILELGIKINEKMQQEAIYLMYITIFLIQITIETVIVKCKKLSDESVVFFFFFSSCSFY